MADAPIAWRSMDDPALEKFEDYYVWLLYDLPAPKGPTPVIGMQRSGTFLGKTVKGWWGQETIMSNGRPTNGMWINGWIKGWLPYNSPAMDAHRA